MHGEILEFYGPCVLTRKRGVHRREGARTKWCFGWVGLLHRREGPRRKWCFGLAKCINGEPEDATTKTNRWMANMNADRLNITTRKIQLLCDDDDGVRWRLPMTKTRWTMGRRAAIIMVFIGRGLHCGHEAG